MRYLKHRGERVAVFSTKEIGEMFDLPDHVEAEELQMRTDREFFKTNPTTKEYIRPMIPGEIIAEPGYNFIRVVKLADGVRLRYPLQLGVKEIRGSEL